MRAKSFHKFLEERESSSPHIDALEDELGIDPRDIEKEPQIASFFSLGKEVRNIGPYRVVSLKRNSEGAITHAVIERRDDRGIKNRRYRDEEGKMTRMGANYEAERMVVPIEDLDRLMSQDFQPPPDAAGGMM